MCQCKSRTGFMTVLWLKTASRTSGFQRALHISTRHRHLQYLQWLCMLCYSLYKFCCLCCGCGQVLARDAPAARDFKGAILAKARQTGVHNSRACRGCKLIQGPVVQRVQQHHHQMYRGIVKMHADVSVRPCLAGYQGFTGISEAWVALCCRLIHTLGSFACPVLQLPLLL